MESLERWLAETAAYPPSGRPLVTLSYAQSLDGSVSLRRGEPLKISGPESQALTHRLRAAHDAILIGIGTVLADDPQMNVRHAVGNDPQVIVLDSHLRLPLTAKLLRNDVKPIIFCVEAADVLAQTKLEDAGARVERQTGGTATEVDLELLLARLMELGISSLMVEGGGSVIASFLYQNMVDRVMITIAPTFIGGFRIPETVTDILPRLKSPEIEKAGEDIIVFGIVDKATT